VRRIDEKKTPKKESAVLQKKTRHVQKRTSKSVALEIHMRKKKRSTAGQLLREKKRGGGGAPFGKLQEGGMEQGRSGKVFRNKRFKNRV